MDLGLPPGMLYKDTLQFCLSRTRGCQAYTECWGSDPHLIYVSKLSVDILGELTQQTDGALVKNMEIEEQAQQTLTAWGILCMKGGNNSHQAWHSTGFSRTVILLAQRWDQACITVSDIFRREITEAVQRHTALNPY